MAKKNKFPKQLELFPKLPKFFPNDLADGGGTAYDPKDDREVDGFLKNKSKTYLSSNVKSAAGACQRLALYIINRLG